MRNTVLLIILTFLIPAGSRAQDPAPATQQNTSATPGNSSAKSPAVDSKKAPTFSRVTCPPGNDSTIALAKIAGAMTACTLNGTDLDLISQVELQNPADPTDKIDGTLSVSGDTTQATVQFSATDLAKLRGTTYTLYYSLKGGSLETTKLTVTVQQVSSAAPRRGTAKTRPLGDYVPCLFDDGESYELRALEDPSTAPLNQAQAQTAANAAKAYLISGAASGSEGDAARNAANTITAETFTSVNASPADVPTVVQAAASKNNVDPAKAAQAGTAAQNAVTAGTFKRPSDVSCSFSVLQWRETSDTFGRRVADEYVAIQVNVRNLNTQNEFLIHDIQIAVDTGLNPKQFGRFSASRDKLIVRDVAQRGQTEDFRNRAINVLEMLGSIAGGASAAVTQSLTSTVAATDFSTSVAIFQGPFITGMINIFPDHTIDHINHINDLTFSASSSNKTVVPVQGSVPLVTFLAEKPLEQLPFAHCGQTALDENDYLTNSICTLDSNPPYPPTATKVADYYGKRLSFKKWNALALAVLERRVFVVIAGVHIKEAAQEPTFTTITCAPGNDATIALAKITGSAASCTLKGGDLDLISQVELENPNDSTDKVDGASSVSGDNTQATVQFNTSDLVKLKGTSYTLYYSLKGGNPEATKLTVTVQQVVSLSATTLTFTQADKGKPKYITLTDNAPDKTINIASVTITGQNASDFKNASSPSVSCGGTTKPLPTAVSTSCTINVTFSGTGASTALLTVLYDVSPQLTQTVDLKATAATAP
jgi:hypothetical protein